MTDESDAYEVGYGKPPKDTRFAPGKSGNPAGRPKRVKRASSSRDPRLDATRRALIERAERPVTILEGGKRKKVSTIEAVHGALVNTALKGGVLAQRTLLELFAKEDALYRSEKQKSFDIWRNYKARAEEQLAAAARKGKPAPDLVPHPEDIHLNYTTLDVRFDGPINKKAAAEKAKLRRHAMLCLELSAYWEETFEFNAEAPERSKIGPFLAEYMVLCRLLPPRLQAQTPEEYAAQRERMLFRRPGGRWETYLAAECAAIGIPLIRPTGPIRFIELKDFCDADQIREIAEGHLQAQQTKELDEALAAAAREQEKVIARWERRRERKRMARQVARGEAKPMGGKQEGQ